MISITSLIIFLLYFHIKCLASNNSDVGTLIGVAAVLYRHGDRGPISSYPNDPYHDLRYWPNGFGQLVDKGKKRHFMLGRWLRSRYNSFLSEQYHYEDILVRSSDSDRTLMSAASNLAGLYYPANGSSFWEENLAWDPIPIHSIPGEDDEILAMAKQCKKFDKLYSETISSEYFKNVLKEHEGIKEFIENNTGWNITEVKYFQTLYSVFYVYKMHNISYLPHWSNEIDFSELAHLAGVSFSTETFTLDLQRLKIGPFFNYLHNYFDGIINGTNPRFLMLSAHDGNVAAILNTYGVYDYHPPHFAETIIWELHKDVSDNIYVKIYLKQNTEFLEELSIPGCLQDCDYNQYQEILDPIVVNGVQWEEECEK